MLSQNADLEFPFDLDAQLMGKLMNTLKHIGSILFAASCCLATPLLAAPVTECGERVLLAKLIANPYKYHGKVLWVVAHITIDFENMTACPSENETQMKSCLWLNIDNGSYKTEQDYPRYEAMLQNWKRFNHQTVAIRATFDKGEKGHFSMWPGGLRNVTEVSGHKEGWSFATNTAVPRTACVGELPVPQVPNESNTGHYLIRALAKEKKHDYAGAIDDYSRAIELALEDKEYLYSSRAEAKEKAGDLDGAIADYTQAIEISQKFAGAYHSRGLVKQKKGDTTGAEADFARARQLAR